MKPSDLDDVLEPTVAVLSASGDDALSKAAAGGFPHWDEVAEWTERLKALVLRQRDASALRTGLRSSNGQLIALLGEVGLSQDVDLVELVARFVERLPAVRAMLAEDVEAAFEGDPAAKGFSEIVLAYPSIHAVAVHRLAHELFLLGVPLIPRIMSEHSHARSGIDIHPGARIGRRFFIDHGTGVVIGETTEIGDRVQLYQGVTLGALSPRRGATAGRETKRHPTLEDDVTVYSGATILGGKTRIGRGSVIGGNVWLTRSVPEESRVVLEPPRLLVRQGRAPDGSIAEQSDWNI